MNDTTQKTALTETLKAEEKKVTAKRPAAKTRKPASTKTTRTKRATAAKPVKKAATPKKPVKKHYKQKTIRDSFTMPENDYSIIASLKKKCLAGGVAVKKSELLRAGVQALAGMSLAELKKQLSKLEEIKIGRPVKEEKGK
jgi:hypothetical protein